MRLEHRDREVLAEAFLSKVVRRNDLIDLGHFGSIPRCNARLLSMNRSGLLRRRNDITGCKLRSPLYSCTAKGVRLAAEFIEMSDTEAIEVHRSGMTDLSIRHALKLLDLRVQFVRESSESNACCQRWFHDLLCRHDFKLSPSTVVSIKPDGMAELRWGPNTAMAFIEVDLGNVSLNKFAEKIKRYQLYRDCGAFRDAYGCDRFAILTVTTNESRLLNLIRAAGRSDFLFSTWPRLSRGLFTEGNWIHGDGKGSSLIRALSEVSK